MSVMTRQPTGTWNTPGTIDGRPRGQITPMAPEVQRQAVIDQLAPPTAGAQPRGGAAPGAPTTGGASPFARGGRVTQLPRDTAGRVADIGTTAGVNTAATLASKGVDAATNAGNLAMGAGIGLGTSALANKLRVKEEMPTFGGEFGEYTDELGRRFEGTGGGLASNAIKYAGMGANPALVGATGGLSVAAGALGGLIKGALTKNAPSAYSDFAVEDAANAIKAQYRRELGRDASDEEVQAHLVNQGWDPTGGDRWVGERGLIGKGGVMEAIRNSPEAAEFKRTGQPATARAALVDQLGATGPTAAADLAGRRTQMDAAGSAPAPPLGTGAGSAAPSAAPGAGGGAPPDASGWNTDGYAAPQYVPPQAGPVPPGFDATKWNDPTHQTPKYAIGRILSQYDGTPEGLAQAMPELERAYPGITSNGKDKITIPGVGTVDVVKASGLGGQGWQWHVPEGETAGGGGGAAPASAASAGQGADLSRGDLLADLQAAIDRITRGEPDRAAVMQQLGGAA